MRSRSWASATRERQVRLRVTTSQKGGRIALGSGDVGASPWPPSAFCQPPLFFLRGVHLDAVPAFHRLALGDPVDGDPAHRKVLSSGGTSNHSPRWVPRALQRSATLSPSAKMSSRVACSWGEAAR